MTERKNAKAWLGRARRIDAEIAELIKVRDDERDRVTRMVQNISGDTVQASLDPHKFDRLVDLELEIDRQIDRLVAIKTETLREIGRLENSLFRTILTKRYLGFETFEMIAVETHVSYRQTLRNHGRALLKMEELWTTT